MTAREPNLRVRRLAAGVGGRDSNASVTMAVNGGVGEIVLSWTGDEELAREFDVLLAECSTLAFRVAFAVLRRRQDAEDVAQEAFAKAYRKFRQLRDRTRFRAWLVRVTWRLAIDRRRSDRRRRTRESQPGDDVVPRAGAEEAVHAAERAARLWDAIDALPEKLRAAIVLSAMEGHDVAEVARLLGIPRGTVKSRLFLARRRLLETLKCLDDRQPNR